MPTIESPGMPPETLTSTVTGTASTPRNVAVGMRTSGAPISCPR